MNTLQNPFTLDTLEETPAAQAPACAHHWLIESPSGKLSRGVCKHCGESKDFSNSLDDVAYVPFDRTDWSAFSTRGNAA